jgi:hypothetical protein
MKQRVLSARPVVTRTSRRDPRGAALESVAAEFALLAQRRARLSRQLDRIGREFDAARTSLDAVQHRMALLAQRMDGIDPSLRPDWPAPAALTAPPPYPPQAAGFAPHTPRPQPQAPAAPPPAFLRPRPPAQRRRSFGPDFAKRHPGDPS